MKTNSIKSLAMSVLCAGSLMGLLTGALTSCTDMGGDGIDTVTWEGSVNPDNSSFHNPVWEPSLDGGTILKGASAYVAISTTTQWAKGLTYLCPVLTSNDLATWDKFTADAFTQASYPVSTEGSEARVNSLSADFARTYSGNKYWLFYTLEGVNGIGCASATSAQGVYTDLGMVSLKNDPQQVSDPFFFVQSKNYYLCYTTADGTYIQKVGLSKTGATIGSSAEPEKIAGPEFKNVAVYYASSSDLYLFGVVDNEIRYARATTAMGPYVDKSGVSLADGSKGEQLITANGVYNVVDNPMRAFINSESSHLFLCYNAIKGDQQTMSSGYARKPVFVQPFQFAEDGWLVGTATPTEGWTAPRFE